MKSFKKPDWQPHALDGAKVLVVGASGGIGQAVVRMLSESTNCVIGAHGRQEGRLPVGENIVPLTASLETMGDCEELVASFVETAGELNGLVVLSGGITSNAHWSKVSEADWQEDINTNLNVPFFMAKAAFPRMMERGGRIVLNGTESALHGGSSTSFAYGIAKYGGECMVKGLARDGAKHNILVNGVRIGFVDSGFHKRWQNKDSADLSDRIDMIPLKRAGHVDEVAALVTYLLSGYAGFITGQMISLSGGDWL